MRSIRLSDCSLSLGLSFQSRYSLLGYVISMENAQLDRTLFTRRHIKVYVFNPLMGTLKPQSNGPLYSNTVIGTLAVDDRRYQM